MRPLLWSDFFKTRDLPLQELDRRMVDADGAILVGSADDRLVSRGKKFDQMRDNVLLEYGLFAGHLGRHRCLLLMPDHPHFRIPSDFLGVAGFEFYDNQTLNTLAKKVPERLKAAFVADGFTPPSLQERCRRLLLLSAWFRGEIAKFRLDHPTRSLQEQLSRQLEAILCFLKEDIDNLGLREDTTSLEELVKKSAGDFPRLPDWEVARHQLEREIHDLLLNPNRLSLISRLDDDRSQYYIDYLEELLGRDGAALFRYARRNNVCPWCYANGGCRHPDGRPYMHSFMPIRGSHCHYLDGSDRCAGPGWYMGAIDTWAILQRHLREIDYTIKSLERWQRDWIPEILDRLGTMEQAVHKQIFGCL